MSDEVGAPTRVGRASVQNKKTKRGFINDADLDETCALDVVSWNGSPAHCAYLNDFRIAGGKPWAGGTTLRSWKGISLRDVIRAFPALQTAVGMDYLGQRKVRRTSPQSKDRT